MGKIGLNLLIADRIIRIFSRISKALGYPQEIVRYLVWGIWWISMRKVL
jgi:hypothetical protein